MTRKIAGLAMGLLVLLAASLFALAPGRYTDYAFSQTYAPPAMPAPIALDCHFFYPSGSTCAVLDSIPAAARNDTTRSLIRRSTPEEDQDWVRFWNSRLSLATYYDNGSDAYGFNQSDGAWAENGSLRNVWVRLVDFYPSVLDEKDNAYYLPGQALVYTPVNMQFVVPNPSGGTYCKQNYHIAGYDYELTKRVNNWSAIGALLPVSQILAPGQRTDLTLDLRAVGAWSRDLSAWDNATGTCQSVSTDGSTDTLELTRTVAIKAYPSQNSFDNHLAVPKEGLAQGLAAVSLPSDFLYYTLTVKGQSYTVRRNDLSIHQRGDVYPVLDLHLIASPSRGGTLHITDLNETDDGVMYGAQVRYQLLVSNADIGPADCTFVWASPFQTYTIPEACNPARSVPTISLNVSNATGGGSRLVARVKDQLGNPLSGLQVQFSGLNVQTTATTDAQGEAAITIAAKESTQTVVARLVGSSDVAGDSATLFVPGSKSTANLGAATVGFLSMLAPIVLIIAILIGLMVWLRRKRSAWLLLPLVLLLVLMAGPVRAQAVGNSTGTLNIQASLTACQNYDFDNAVRHFGECAEAYRISTEFNALRQTAAILVANIAPLVVANPDVAPYKAAYANMVMIALALFRVAWAFNSLYLILNIFNPSKRSEALKQYGWLIIFVFFVYGSYILLQDTVTLVNSVSAQVAGTDAAATLQQATGSIGFLVENYQMLQMVLPLLHLTYLILLARYITVIGMILFFPFTLLLFFTAATRGFGRAALTITFASLGLGVVNAILLLIYGILAKTADPTLSGTFASTFFSASFIVFFGFVNVLVLAVAFLSGILFIGRSGSENAAAG